MKRLTAAINWLRANSIPLFLIALGLYSAAFLRGVQTVPFHPDETSYLFMSNELKTMLTNPASLFYSPTAPDWKRQTMRLLNPPLPELIVELGRRTTGLPPLPRDWAFNQTWDENAAGGAVPDPRLLQAGRLSVAVLFPFSLLFFFLAVRRATNDFTAWVTALLMASNALLLLHMRRGMAEGVLVFCLCLFTWALIKAEKRPWLAAIPAALGLCAKTSLAPLALVGLVAVLWQARSGDDRSQPGKSETAQPDPAQAEPERSQTETARDEPAQQAGDAGQPSAHPRRAWRALILARLGQAALYLALFGLIVFALYPIAWQHPLETFQAAAYHRDNLLQAQMRDYPSFARPALLDRPAGMLRQLFVVPPAFAESPNYRAATQASEAAYLANPLHNLLRSPWGGGLLLGLAILGLGIALWRLRHMHWLAPCPADRRLALLLLLTGAQAAAEWVAVPLEWQRYFMPLVPLACLWAAYGLDWVRGWARWVGVPKRG